MPLELDTASLRKAFKEVPKLLSTSIKFGYEQIGDDFAEAMSKRFEGSLTGPWKRQAASNQLANRTGNLRRSQRQTVTGSNLDSLKLRATIGNALTAPYAAIQEEGGTVRPKKAGGFLTIPMPDNLTPAGRTKVTRPRSDPSIFVLRTNGRAFLVRKSASGEGLEFLFMLKKQVKIPARLGFGETWTSPKFKENIQRRLQERVDKALRVAGLL